MEKETRKKDKGLLREYFELIAETAVFVFFVMTFVVQAFQIPTGSMEPTLLIGDFLLVNKLVYASTISPIEETILPHKPIRRQDIIVFKYPNDLTKDFVKRVIGLPGETVTVRDGGVFINGQPLGEDYIAEQPLRDFGPETIPPNEYFMMGDNRNHSSDSRVWGFVPQSLVKGRALLIWWSYQEDSVEANPRGIVDGTKSIASKALHFFTRSRWSRCFTLIR